MKYKSLLENLFVVVRFDIVTGRNKLLNVWETLDTVKWP